jgi:myo-inositol 2-dehydrogenase/D-chiro-inositol 1-dehydrogenase
MPQKLRLGVIGAGRIGKLHAENVAYNVPGARLTAIADANMTQELDAWAKGLGIAKVSKNPDDIIEAGDIDAVLVCGPTNTHADLTIAAARAKKHVFCEQPVAVSAAKVRAAIDEAGKAGVKFQVGFNRRFDHNFRRVREAALSGALGDIRCVKITSRDPVSPPAAYIRVSGGIFLDMMIHDFDMARFQAGCDIAEVYAAGAVLIDPEIGQAGDIDTALVTLRFSNGAFGVIENSRQAVYGCDQRLEVFGSKGEARAENDAPTSVRISTKDGVTGDRPFYFFLERYRGAFVAEINSFVASIAGDTPVEATGEDALADMYAAMAAGKSLRERRPVTIEEILKDEGAK